MNASQHNYLAESIDYQMGRATRGVDIVLLGIRRDMHRAAVGGQFVDAALDGAPVDEDVVPHKTADRAWRRHLHIGRAA